MEGKTPSKYEQFVITDLPRFVEMPGHNRPAPSWIYPDMFPEVKHCFTVLKCDSPNYVFGIHVMNYRK